ETVRRLHRRAATWFLERGEDEQAIEHLLAAGDYEAAADLFRPLRERLFLTSRYHLLERWLEQFPPSIAEAHPWLLLTRARLALMRGERASARRLCAQAEPFLKAQGDRSGLYTVYHDLAEIAKGNGDFHQAEALYRQALEYTVDDSQRAVCLGQMARCLYMRGGNVEEALRLLEQGMELAERSGFMLGRAGLLSLKGKMLSALGDFRAAIEAWHTALDLMEAYGNRHQQIGILDNAAYHHCLLGEFDQAEPLARRALELAHLFNRSTHYAYALNILGVIHQGRGEWEAARRCHQEALAIQRRLGERYEIPVTLNWLGLLARREGRLEEALHYGEESLTLREKLESDYETGLTLIDLGATYLELSQWERAESLWRRALDIFVRHKARYEQAQLHFYLAVSAHRRGDARAANEHLNASLELARRYGYEYLFVQDASWAAPLLLPLALEGEPFATEVFLRLGTPACELLLPLLKEQDESTRIRAIRLLGELGDEAAIKPLASLRRASSPYVRQAAEAALKAILSRPPPPLRVQTLGGFRLWRGGEEITRWPRRSARDLFLFLLAQYPQPVPAEALAELLWPQSSPRKARQNLRRAVADLRHTLEPDLPAAFPSRYIITGEETYSLSLPEGSWVDVWAFEEKLSAALALPCGNYEERRRALDALEKALSFYGGDYLPEIPYEDWALLRRERLRERYLTGLRRLARLRLEQGDVDGALEAGHRALEIDPWDEESVLLLMQAYQARGDVPAALGVYETFRDRLKRDIDLPPRDDLTALYNALRKQ
ncbi:MAG TPA: tetratricopeptide repeat protein, partial [Chloroflexi bacterium]|nr:tetratricopeptide repeat protein [Chloroflexota bacterium]